MTGDLERDSGSSGSVVITADPDRNPDLDVLAGAVQAELGAITGADVTALA